MPKGPPPKNWDDADILQGLASRHKGERDAALKKLHELHWRTSTITDASGLDSLLRSIRENDWDARSALGWLLKKVRDRRAIPRLVELLSHRDDSLSFNAREALDAMGWKPSEPRQEVARLLCASDYGPLIKMGCAAVPFLLEVLASETPEHKRSFAATALGMIGDPLAAEALGGLAQGPRGSVRSAAILALGALGEPDAVPLLRRLAVEESDTNAATALARLGAAAELVEVLQAWPPAARWQVAEYLGDLGQPLAADALLEQTSEGDDRLRTYAALALGKLTDPRALPALFAAMEGGWHSAEAAGYVEGVLKRASPQVPLEDLRVAADFPGTTVIITGQAEGFGSDPIVGYETIDGSPVRRLALQELKRRGCRC